MRLLLFISAVEVESATLQGGTTSRVSEVLRSFFDWVEKAPEWGVGVRYCETVFGFTFTGVICDSSFSSGWDKENGRGAEGGSNRADTPEPCTTAFSSVTGADGMWEEVIDTSSVLCTVDGVEMGINGEVTCATSTVERGQQTLSEKARVRDCSGVVDDCASARTRHARRTAKGR